MTRAEKLKAIRDRAIANQAKSKRFEDPNKLVLQMPTKGEAHYYVRLLPIFSDALAEKGFPDTLEVEQHSISYNNKFSYVITESDCFTRSFFAAKNTLDDEDFERYKKIFGRNTRVLHNVYVIDDPLNPANNGTIKYIAMSYGLAAAVMASINSDDVDDGGVGTAGYDLSPKGKTLKITVGRKPAGEGKVLPTYTPTFVGKYATLTNNDGEPLTSEDCDKIYGSVFDLRTCVRYDSPADAERKLLEVITDAFPILLDDEQASAKKESVKSDVTANKQVTADDMEAVLGDESNDDDEINIDTLDDDWA